MATAIHRQCSICLEDFKQPKFLDCFHTFCLECLRGLEKKTGFINCPLCQRKIQLPSGGVDKLTANFYIQDAEEVRFKNIESRSDKTGAIRSVHKERRSLKPSENQTKSRVHKLISMITGYDFGPPIILTIGGIELHLKLGSTRHCLTLSIELSEKNEFIHSCYIDYDIKLINQKDAEFSTRTTGEGYSQSRQGYPYKSEDVDVDLIRVRDAFNGRNGFIVKTLSDEEFTFELRVDITVSNIKKVNFNLD